MKNITLDTTSFSEHLGIYDFFNVILAGLAFMLGLGLIHDDLFEYIGTNLSLIKGLAVIVFIYLWGMILQEAGSYCDKKFFKIYSGMTKRILKGKIDIGYECETNNDIIKNPFVLARYRKSAEKLLLDLGFDKEKIEYENDQLNGFVFSTCQYYVSVYGKDKKIEKMRALFAMSKTLMSCFFLLTILAFLSLFFNTDPLLGILDNVSIFSILDCKACAAKGMLILIFGVMGILFVNRAKRTMKNFLLILLGTYNALVSTVGSDDKQQWKKRKGKKKDVGQ